MSEDQRRMFSVDTGSLFDIITKAQAEGKLPAKKVNHQLPTNQQQVLVQAQQPIVKPQQSSTSSSDSETSIKESNEESSEEEEEEEQRIEVEEPTLIINEDKEKEADNDFVTKPTFNVVKAPKKDNKKAVKEKKVKKTKKTKKDDEKKKKKDKKKAKKSSKKEESSSSSSKEEEEEKQVKKKVNKKKKRDDKEATCDEESPKKKAKKTKNDDDKKTPKKVNKKKKRDDNASCEEKEEESPKKKVKKAKNDDDDDAKTKVKKTLGEEDQKIEDMRKVFCFNELEEGNSYSKEVKQALFDSYHKYHDQKYTKLNVNSPYHRLALFIKANNDTPSSLSPIITRDDFYKIDFGTKTKLKDKDVIQSIKQAAASALLINEEKLKLDSFQDQFNYVNNHNNNKNKVNVVDNNAVSFKVNPCKEVDDELKYYFLAQKDGEKYNTFIKPVDKSKQELVVLPQKVFSTNKSKTKDTIVQPRLDRFRTFLDKKEEINTLIKYPSSTVVLKKTTTESPTSSSSSTISSTTSTTPKIEEEDDEIIKDDDKKKKEKKTPTKKNKKVKITTTTTTLKVEEGEEDHDDKIKKDKKNKLPKKLETVSNNFITKVADSFDDSSIITSSLTPTTTPTTTPTPLSSSSSSNPNKVPMMLKMDKGQIREKQAQKPVQQEQFMTPADFAEYIEPLNRFGPMISKLIQQVEELQNRQRKVISRFSMNYTDYGMLNDDNNH